MPAAFELTASGCDPEATVDCGAARRRLRSPLARSAALAALGGGLLALLSAALRPEEAGGAEEVDGERIENLYEHSIQVAEEVRRGLPRAAQPVFNLGFVHKRFGFDDRAVAAFREGLRLDPKRPDVLAEVGFLLSQRNHLDEALAAYQEALRLEPRSPSARTRIGLIRVHQGKHALAVEEFRGEILNRTANAFTYTMLGHALRDLGRYEEARNSYAEAVRLDPGERGAHYGLAQLHRLLGRPDEEARARAEFLKLKARDDRGSEADRSERSNRRSLLASTAETYADAGETWLLAGRAAEAERAFRAAVRFEPLLARARRRLVVMLRDSRRLDEALAHCRELAAQARSGEHLFLLAGLNTEKGDFAEAARLLEEVMRIDRADGDAPRELARLILGGRIAGDGARALELARRAVEAVPHALNYSILSWALYQKGDVQGAVGALETAARLDPASYRQRLEELRKTLR